MAAGPLVVRCARHAGLLSTKAKRKNASQRETRHTARSNTQPESTVHGRYTGGVPHLWLPAHVQLARTEEEVEAQEQQARVKAPVVLMAEQLRCHHHGQRSP